jgi:hypothetical protein
MRGQKKRNALYLEFERASVLLQLRLTVSCATVIVKEERDLAKHENIQSDHVNTW